MTDDPNADLIGFSWRQKWRGYLPQMVTRTVTGTSTGSTLYVNITDTNDDGSVADHSVALASYIRSRKALAG